MMSRHSHHPDQMSLTFAQRAELEDFIEARASVQAEAQALRWRLRLIALESAMMAAFLFGGSLALHQSFLRAMRNAALTGAGCLFVGCLAMGFASMTGRLLSHLIDKVAARLGTRGPRP